LAILASRFEIVVNLPAFEDSLGRESVKNQSEIQKLYFFAAAALEESAKWDEFKNDVLSKYTIELVDNEPIAIDKDNEHKRKPLKELLEGNSNIGDLLKTRQQSGTGAKSADLMDVEGVPFKVPQGATSEEQSKMVREYLVEKLGSPLHKDFSKEMVDLLTKVKRSAK